jgi:hypothetical protein
MPRDLPQTSKSVIARCGQPGASLFEDTFFSEKTFTLKKFGHSEYLP